MKKLSLVVVCFFASYALIFAQDKSDKLPYDRWEIGVNLGVANYAGSQNMSKQNFMNHYNHYSNDMNFGYGLFARKNFSHIFALEGAFNGATLTGTPKSSFPLWHSNYPDGSKPVKRLPYKTGVNQIGVSTVWNMNNILSKNKFDRKVYWYTKLGAGLALVNNKEFTDFSGSGGHFAVPMGTGVSFRLGDNLKLDLGTQWSWVTTSRFDGVKQNPPAVGAYLGYKSDQITDQYLFTHAGLSFMLGKKPVKKPEPVVEAPKPQPKPEPKPEPKPVAPAPPKHVTPAVVGQIFKVYFDFDKWNIRSDAKAELDRLAKEMQDNPTVNLEMKSHTDSRGPASYNMKLSEKRGKSVLDYLNAKGISSSRINAQAFGETQLVNKCKDGVKCKEAEHQLNRRTETLVIE